MRFGEFVAVNDVTASFELGQVHAIVGQNGAGKTTLSRVLAGLVQPQTGSVRVGEELLPGGSVAEARRHGVELVHQHFALPADFTVAQCFELFNSDPRPLGAFTKSQLWGRAERLLVDAGNVSPDDLIGRLPVESLQAVEIARALASDPRVLILDEPTAVLPPPAQQRLFDRLRALAASGMCVIVVLHKMREVFAVADTATALRAGSVVLPPTRINELSRASLAAAIIGGVPVEAVSSVRRPTSETQVVLKTVALTAQSSAHDAPVNDVSLEIRRGEILGIAGVEGNGQRSLVEGIAGVASRRHGEVWLGEKDMSKASVMARRGRGLRVIPFERNAEGVSLSSSLWENHAAMRCGQDRWVIRPTVLRQRCRGALDRWKVSYRSETELMGNLSGGNVQKAILAREITGELSVLIAAHPTRGLDIAASRDVREALVQVAAAGVGVMLVSADLEEMFEVSHRIVVMLAGRAVGVFSAPFDVEHVGAAMVGGGHR